MRFLLILSLVFSNKLHPADVQTLSQIQALVKNARYASLALSFSVVGMNLFMTKPCAAPPFSTPLSLLPKLCATLDIPYSPASPTCTSTAWWYATKLSCTISNVLIVSNISLSAINLILNKVMKALIETETDPKSDITPPEAPELLYNEVVCTTLTPDLAVKECICIQTGWVWESENCVEPIGEEKDDSSGRESKFLASKNSKNENLSESANDALSSNIASSGSSSSSGDVSGLKNSLNYLASVKDKVAGMIKDQNASLNKTDYNSAFSNVMSESKGFRASSTASRKREIVKETDDIFESISGRYNEYQAGFSSIQK